MHMKLFGCSMYWFAIFKAAVIIVDLKLFEFTKNYVRILK